MDYQQALSSGDISGAARAIEASLEGNPNPGLSFVLFELKTLLEEFDEARTALEAALGSDPGLEGARADLGSCIDGEQERALRRRLDGRAGKRASVAPPPPFAFALAEAEVAHAAANFARAKEILETLEIPAVAGRMMVAGDSFEFESLTDTDDLTGPQLECFVPGSSLVIPLSEIARIDFATARGYQDVLWIPTRVEMRSGDVLLCRVPSLYTGSGRHPDAQHRLGQMTSWSHTHGYAIGSGQRDWRASGGEGARLVGIRQIRAVQLWR